MAKASFLMMWLTFDPHALQLLSLKHEASAKGLFIFETEHDKTNKMTYASNEDSVQYKHLPSLCCLLEDGLGPQPPIKRTAKTNQTGRMPRLI